MNSHEFEYDGKNDLERINLVRVYLKNESVLKPYLIMNKSVENLSKYDIRYAIDRYNVNNRKKIKI